MAINQSEVRTAVMGLNLTGSEENGLLRAFGVILANNSVDYLVGREFAFMNSLGPKAIDMVNKVLIDAAQWCAYATFGGMMESQEWAMLIEPNVANINDRLDGLVAIANCLGWGKVTSVDLDEQNQTLTMRVDHSYYVDSWLKQFGKSDRAICCMWTGVAAGFLDLIFGNKVHDFESTEVLCGAKGDGYCEFKAKRVAKSFGRM